VSTLNLIPISETAGQVCASHYQGGKGCGRCPIGYVCMAPVVPLTEASLNRHTEAVNAAADAYGSEA